MSRFILRLFCALLLTSMTLGQPATPRSDPSEHEVATGEDDLGFDIISISPTSGNPPLAVRVQGSASDSYPYLAGIDVYVDFAGTTYYKSSGSFAGFVEFDFTHMFACPGTYEIRAWCQFNGMHDLRSWTVEVTGEPVAKYTIVPDHATRPTRIRLEYFGLENRELITRSTIDWGDGSGTKDVTVKMFATGHLYGQPAHYPTTPGEFTVTSINYYGDGPCDPAPVTTTWTSPIVVLPVEATTWGRVKALYK
ncbi:MAG: hypothetical protein IH969_04835 [Candidatus Krumholzibacteriota bacterium]|nr:hypothetical protein [Candidatus Krumholzibacteriota bacterium]